MTQTALVVVVLGVVDDGGYGGEVTITAVLVVVIQ